MSADIEMPRNIRSRKTKKEEPKDESVSRVDSQEKKQKSDDKNKSDFSKNFVLGISGESSEHRMRRITKLW